MTDQQVVSAAIAGISGEMLDMLMPMHVWFGPDGRVIRTGPTFTKLYGSDKLAGENVMDLFAIRRTGTQNSMATLLAMAGQRLSLSLTSLPDLPMRAQCVAMPENSGGILNLSLGLSFAEAVDVRGLTLHDFSPCDHTVDLLYLREAIAAVAKESRRLTDRLLAAERAAALRAATDELTGLANRRALAAHLDQLLWDSTKNFGLMQIDLDHFKEVNDTYGHHAGDAILRRVSSVLKSAIRDGDVAARTGGDEFVLVIRGTDDPETLDYVAQRVLRQLKSPVEFDGHEFEIGASIGTTRSSLYARPDADQMLRDADEALYASKRQGRGRNCFFEPPAPEGTILP